VNGGAYAHVRRRRITGPGSSKNDWHIDGFRWPTVACPDQDEGCHTKRDDDPLTPKRGHLRGQRNGIMTHRPTTVTV
jgi:hypothetical protein